MLKESKEAARGWAWRQCQGQRSDLEGLCKPLENLNKGKFYSESFKTKVYICVCVCMHSTLSCEREGEEGRRKQKRDRGFNFQKGTLAAM